MTGPGGAAGPTGLRAAARRTPRCDRRMPGMTAVDQDVSRVVVQCTTCGAQFKVGRQFLNRQAKCTKCGERFLAREPGSAPPSADSDNRSQADARLGSTLGQFKIMGVLGK